MQRQFALKGRRLLAGFFAATGIAYGILLIATYLQITAPSSLAPELSEVNRLLFNLNRPISPLEHRLEISNTPLGTGPLVSEVTAGDARTSAGSMRMAFTGATSSISNPLTPEELAQREGERQALLDWIRSGAHRNAYERDDFQLINPIGIITPELLLPKTSHEASSAKPRVRIRSLINERCVICHNEAEGDATARLVPFDSYQSIARYLAPDAQANRARPWLLATLFSLFPLAALVGPTFAHTTHPLVMRRRFLALTSAALLGMTLAWLAGPTFFGLIIPLAIAAAIGISLQLLATIAEYGGVSRL